MLYPAFSHPRVISGVTTVDTSVLPFPGLTFSTANNTSAEHVHQSYELLAKSLAVDRHSIISLHQIHSDKIHIVTETQSFNLAPLRGEQFMGDAMVTNVPGIVLGIKVADCAAVLLWDTVKGAVAAVHSGWRGTSQNIAGKTVRTMMHQFGTDPHDVMAWISPHATAANYEVGKDVYNVLSAYCTPHPEKPEKWFYSNADAISEQVTDAGGKKEKIIIDQHCTMTDKRFHSHRRDGNHAGRGLAFIGLRSLN